MVVRSAFRSKREVNDDDKSRPLEEVAGESKARFKKHVIAAEIVDRDHCVLQLRERRVPNSVDEFSDFLEGWIVSGGGLAPGTAGYDIANSQQHRNHQKETGASPQTLIL